MKVELHCGDCLEIMKNIKSNSVDFILADLPYGTTKRNFIGIEKEPKFYQFAEQQIMKAKQEILLV